MCCVVREAGLEAARRARPPAGPGRRARSTPPAAQGEGPAAGLRQARREVHVAGGCSRCPPSPARRRRRARARRSARCRRLGAATARAGRPRSRRPAAARRPRAPRLPAHGRRRRRASRSSASRPCAPMRRSRSVAAVAPAAGVDLLVELDDRLPIGAAAAKLERYDHFVIGLVAAHAALRAPARRTALRRVRVPRPRAGARVRAPRRRRPDGVPRLQRRVPAPSGSTRDASAILFVAERDVHEGQPRRLRRRPVAAGGARRAGRAAIPRPARPSHGSECCPVARVGASALMTSPRLTRSRPAARTPSPPARGARLRRRPRRREGGNGGDVRSAERNGGAPAVPRPCPSREQAAGAYRRSPRVPCDPVPRLDAPRRASHPDRCPPRRPAAVRMPASAAPALRRTLLPRPACRSDHPLPTEVA